ncbi:acetolactate synthase large subunit [Streptomyces violaceorubidus]
MGAQAGMPGRTVWAIDGDGCFQMTNQELTTCASEQHLRSRSPSSTTAPSGWSCQWQTLFYNQRYSNTVLHSGPDDVNPDARGTRGPHFVKLSEAMGCYAIRCEDPADLDKVIEEANSVNDRPVVVDFIVHEDAMVWPMVAAGTSNDEIGTLLNTYASGPQRRASSTRLATLHRMRPSGRPSALDL